MPQTSNTAADAAGPARIGLRIIGAMQPRAGRRETTEAVGHCDRRPIRAQAPPSLPKRWCGR